MSRILVIDDDHDIVSLLKKFLTKHGYEVETAYSGAAGKKIAETFDPDLVMCDYRLDDMDGSELLKSVKERRPDLPVIIITGYSDLRLAVNLVKLGAFDYMTKPFIPDEILFNISQALNQKNGKQSASKNNYSASYLFSSSPQSLKLKRQISLVASTDYSVIIYGESGVGKEGVAHLIHEKSSRKNKPFVAMDCGAISKELAASELFGHEKGAFTGAMNQKIGHFEMANGGTLFLDEIGNLPYDVQTLLLRVLQEKTLRRLGSNKEIDIDVRIIIASNERLTEAIQKGKFREDLYHRLNEFNIEITPLRMRKNDIMFFADSFLPEICKTLNKHLAGFDHEVKQVFMNYPWPGNIRELKNVIKRAALLSNEGSVDLKSLPAEILAYLNIRMEGGESEKPELLEPYEAVGSYQQQQHSDTSQSSDLSKPKLKKVALEAEYEMILDALGRANFNRSKAAVLLGIDRKTLYNKMKQMKLTHK